MRLLCRTLIAEADTEFEAIHGFARPLTASMMSYVLGVSAEDILGFQHWDLNCRLAFITKVIEGKEKSSENDILSLLIRATKFGESIRSERLVGCIFLLLIAGVETTTAALGSALLHLATNPQDQHKIRTNAGLLPAAIEEFLRAFSPVSSARVAIENTSIGSCPISVGEKVLMSFAAANRDPTRFEEPDSIIICRASRQHAAFGLGIHQCLGAGLARKLMLVALEEWLSATSYFSAQSVSSLEWTGGNVRGLKQLPLSLICV